jgi:hypothetical protein
MHFVARGMTTWGAALALNLRWVRRSMSCPLNASRYAGLAMDMKGVGSLPVQVATFRTANAPGGGGCTSQCFDHHQAIVQASPSWKTHEIRWQDLHQEGWGQATRFEPDALVGIHFAPRPADLPLDVWIDNVRFIPR